MPTMNIVGKEYYLYKIFSNDFKFFIPRYQRPYSWTKEETIELFDDLWSAFMVGDTNIDNKEPYFLGSMVLIKQENSPKSEVIDGQQRLTTLTILLTILRFLITNNDFSSNITQLLQQEGSPIMGIKGDYRLTIRDTDNPFYKKYIQEDGNISLLINKNSISLQNDPQRNICENAICLYNQLKDKTEEQLKLFTSYIIKKCIIVVVSTPNVDSAYKIFSVMNDRGLDLTTADLLKAEIIGAIDDTHDQEIYENKWIETEDMLKRDLFNDLFAHIRMIYLKRKAKADTLKELRESIKPSTNPIKFIDDVLIPCGDILNTIKDSNFKSEFDSRSINNYLYWLNMIDNADWIPPTIVALRDHSNDIKWLDKFFEKFDRLVSILFLTRANINERLERFGLLMDWIENKRDIFSNDSPVNISKDEKKLTKDILDSNIYEMSKINRYLLLRLDQQISGAGVRYDHQTISIEHVLPQKPKEDSIWLNWFPEQKDRDKWVHKIGNLVLLSRKKNSSAQNYDFKQKKEKYFVSDDMTTFALTSQVLMVNEWTVETICKRQENNLQILRKLWDF